MPDPLAARLKFLIVDILRLEGVQPEDLKDEEPLIGSGLEYVQSRPYQPGDSIRQIDWRVTRYIEPAWQAVQEAFVLAPQVPTGGKWVNSDWVAGRCGSGISCKPSAR